MIDLMNPDRLTVASLAVSLLMLIMGLGVWFFVHRANEQIELLRALLEQQKRQNALLLRLCEANEPEKDESVEMAENKMISQKDDDLIRLVAER